MKAIILVGGEATRLRPLTCHTPKATVPVLNIPFLEHVINHLRDHRVKDIILAQGRLSQPIEEHFKNGSQFGVRLIYSLEDEPLGTAGAIKNAESHLDETFLVLNGDIFTDLDLTAMAKYHKEHKAKVSIARTPVEDPTAFGLIETDDRGRVTRFLEKPGWDQVTTNMINAGTYVLEPEVLNLIPSQTKVGIEREVFPQLLERDEPVYAYDSPAYWIDIGTPEKYLQLNKDLLSGKSRRYAPAPGKEVQIGENCSLHPTVKIDGPAVIGSHCTIGQDVRLTGPLVIGSGCTILENSVIKESVIWQNARIGPGVNIQNSIVANDCCLEAESTISESVIGNNVSIICGSQIESGSKIWPPGYTETEG